MNPKYQKVCADIAKTEKKVEDLQEQLKELYDKKTELENLEIVNTVRAMVMDKDQIMAFLSTMKDGKSTKNEDTTEVSADEQEKRISPDHYADRLHFAGGQLFYDGICLRG